MTDPIAEELARIRRDMNTGFSGINFDFGDADTLGGATLAQARSLPWCIFSLSGSQSCDTDDEIVQFNTFYNPFPTYYMQSNPDPLIDPQNLSGDTFRVKILQSGLYEIKYILLTNNLSQRFYVRIVYEAWGALYAGEQYQDQVNFEVQTFGSRRKMSSSVVIGQGSEKNEVGVRVFRVESNPFQIKSFPNNDPQASDIVPYLFVSRTGDISAPVV